MGLHSTWRAVNVRILGKIGQRGCARFVADVGNGGPTGPSRHWNCGPKRLKVGGGASLDSPNEVAWTETLGWQPCCSVQCVRLPNLRRVAKSRTTRDRRGSRWTPSPFSQTAELGGRRWRRNGGMVDASGPAARAGRSCCWSAAGLCLVWLVAGGWGNRPSGNGRSIRPNRNRGVAAGRITAVGPGALQVTKQGEPTPWVLKPSPTATEISFTATADPSWLARKMIVRVEGNFDRKGTAQEPIERVQVFTPRPAYQVGVWDAEGRPPKPQKTPQPLMVAGGITRIDGQEVTVRAGKRTFRFQLGTAARVEVDLLGDLRWVRAGDEVEFSAKYLIPGQGVASKLVVSSAVPLKAPPQRRSSRRSRAASSANAAPRDRVPEAQSDGGRTACLRRVRLPPSGHRKRAPLMSPSLGPGRPHHGQVPDQRRC